MKNIELAKSQIAARVLESVLKTLDERTVTGLMESAWQQLRGQKAEHADCTLDKETLQQLLWLHNEAGGWITEEANEGGFLRATGRFIEARSENPDRFNQVGTGTRPGLPPFGGKGEV